MPVINSFRLLRSFVLLCFFSLAATSHAQTSPQNTQAQVLVTTNMGQFTLELNPSRAPKTVANFLKYIEDGHYEGTIFHRVIKDFMIQGGGFTVSMDQKPTRPSITNEANNGLKNDRGTIAMARTGDPHSATAQFFINTVDNGFLNFPAQDGWGYCVFGKVVSGMSVIDKIRSVATGNTMQYQNVPSTPVVIKSMTLLSAQPAVPVLPPAATTPAK